MIKGAHDMFYTPQAGELRAFIRDKLGFPYTDTSCHPSERAFHGISFYCAATRPKKPALQVLQRAIGVGFSRCRFCANQTRHEIN